MSQGSSSFGWSTIVEEATLWVQQKGLWWLASVSVHVVILAGVVMMMDTVVHHPPNNDAPAFESEVNQLPPDETIEHFVLGDPPLEPTELNVDTIMAAAPTVEAQANTTDADPFVEDGGGTTGVGAALGGGEGFAIFGEGGGPMLKQAGGAGGAGEGIKPGRGGSHQGFNQRGSGVRAAMLGNGGTKESERAVAGALNWIARHQLPGGNWSLNNYQQKCKDDSCSGKGAIEADSAATAMALLPFLAAGQTHLAKDKSPYRKEIQAGLYWFLDNIKTDGDMSANAGGNAKMYTHGLATICLCEAYGLSGDRRIGDAAQQALNFIIKAQNATEGGWRYQGSPTEVGDTSVVGWQVMALKSGIMAGLDVPIAALNGAGKFLQAASHGKGGLFAYTIGGGPSVPMTSVGLLCSQYLGMKRTDPAMVEGIGMLMGNMPHPEGRNIYYWYYATQVMHNVPGADWDTWNRKMRRVLITSQVKSGCAEGSWDPLEPTKDAHGEVGGRLMVTSLSALTLEVYYRYLPLYKLDEVEKPAADSK